MIYNVPRVEKLILSFPPSSHDKLLNVCFSSFALLNPTTTRHTFGIKPACLANLTSNLCTFTFTTYGYFSTNETEADICKARDFAFFACANK